MWERSRVVHALDFFLLSKYFSHKSLPNLSISGVYIVIRSENIVIIVSDIPNEAVTPAILTTPVVTIANEIPHQNRATKRKAIATDLL